MQHILVCCLYVFLWCHKELIAQWAVTSIDMLKVIGNDLICTLRSIYFTYYCSIK